ncbi:MULTISPECIES: 3'-5' exoribonuclease YhaM family protein [Calditerrivibrio]|uniref:3'-5' exoribonuclease YhaM family protein n=1 Tax=Calditerrivibrio TaxID=545865 RepID=UPI003C71D304
MDMNLNKKYMIMEIAKSNTKDNRPFIKVVLIDKDGVQIQGIMFDSNKLKFDPQKGDVVDVSGTIQSYNGQFQIKINNMSKMPEEESKDFLPKGDFDENQLYDEFVSFVESNLQDRFIKALFREFKNDQDVTTKFKKMPAAKNVHHAYIGGLLEHTYSVVRLAVIMSNYYKVNRDLLMAGAIFHDIGKVFELDISKGFEYTDSGKLIGHLLLGIELVNSYCAKIDNFPELYRHVINHMIASHHGLLEYGSPKKPKTLEAIILHHIDDMDAKVNTFKSIFIKDNITAGGWSNYDRLLERQIFNHNIMMEDSDA